MAILKIARMGHPVLRQVADPVVDPTDPEILRLARDMVETMLDAGGVGLAAPQVHVPLRMIVFRVPRERVEEGEEAQPGISVVLNPEIAPLGDATLLAWEGCLSIPGLRGAVPRFERIRYAGFDLAGGPMAVEAAGFHARVVQHEVDHLDGVLYLDRMEDLRRLAFEEEMRRHHMPEATGG